MTYTEYIIETNTLTNPDDFFSIFHTTQRSEAIKEAKRFYNNTKDNPKCSSVYLLKKVTTNISYLYQ